MYNVYMKPISRTTALGVITLLLVMAQICQNPQAIKNPEVIIELLTGAGFIVAGDAVKPTVTVTKTEDDDEENVVK